MGYPLRYRDVGPQTVSRPLPRSPGSGSVVRFPRPYRSPRLPFGPPTAIPGRPNFGLRPPYRPAPFRPSIPGGYGRALGTGTALGIALWWALNNDWNWATNPLPSVPGWQHVCGPFPWPGPPYLQNTHWTWLPTAITGCIAPLGGQALIVDVAPAPGDDTLLLSYGPNQNGRYYVYDHYVRPAGGADPALAPQYRPMPVIRGPGAGLAGLPTDFVPNPMAPPIGLSPWFPPEPPYPQGPSRGYVAPGGPYNSTGAIDLVQNAQGQSLSVRTSQQREPDRRPPPRERERKLESQSRAGRLLIGTWKAMQTWGQINGAVNALWHALPKSARTANARWWQKYDDVYRHFDEIDLEQAALNSAAYAASIRAFGAAYSAQNRFLRAHAGENMGWRIDRGLNREQREFKWAARAFRPRRKSYRNAMAGRWDRVYSGRASAKRRFRRYINRKIRRYG